MRRSSRKKPPLGPSGPSVAAQTIPLAPRSTERGADTPPIRVRTQPGQTGVHTMPLVGQLSREDARERVQRRLRDAVSVLGPGAEILPLCPLNVLLEQSVERCTVERRVEQATREVRPKATELPHTARDHHDVRARGEPIDEPGREERWPSIVHGERAPDHVRVEPIERSPRVVHDRVEPRFSRERLDEPLNARGVTEVHGHGPRIEAQAAGRLVALRRIARSHQDAPAARQELPCRLVPETAVGTGDQRERHDPKHMSPEADRCKITGSYGDVNPPEIDVGPLRARLRNHCSCSDPGRPH